MDSPLRSTLRCDPINFSLDARLARVRSDARLKARTDSFSHQFSAKPCAPHVLRMRNRFKMAWITARWIITDVFDIHIQSWTVQKLIDEAMRRILLAATTPVRFLDLPIAFVFAALEWPAFKLTTLVDFRPQPISKRSHSTLRVFTPIQ